MRTFIAVAHSDSGDVLINNKGKKYFTTLYAAQQASNQAKRYINDNIEIYKRVDLD